MNKQDELRLLVKIATLYYEHGHNQSRIARVLNLSQSFVSRAIKRCIDDGIVKITVLHPPGVFVAEEQALQVKYGIRQVVIVDVEDSPSAYAIKRAIGSGAAAYLETSLTGNELIGISSWSTFVEEMINSLYPRAAKARGVVQILGGAGVNGNLHANMLSDRLAKLLECPSYLLPIPSMGRTREERQRDLKDPEVSQVINKFQEVNTAIVGIGTTEPSQLLRNSGVNYQDETYKQLAELGAVGDICLHYFDRNGKPVIEQDQDPVISMSLQQLHDCENVIGLAGGQEKVEAIKAALNGGYIDVLVTDRVTASFL